MLTVLGVSGLLLALLASIFKTGLWEVNRSSGRIEVVRNGRQAMDNIQRYLSSVMPPRGVQDTLGASLQETRAIFAPDYDELHDPEAGNPQAPQQRIQFFSQTDHLTGALPLSARQLTLNPPNFAYEITTVPGANNQGQDLVLRRLVVPAPFDDLALPLNPDVGVQARYLGRRIGIPDAGAPGGFRDGFLVQRLAGGALAVQINVSSGLISDDLVRNRVEDATPMVITMNTIIQPPYFNLE